MSGRYPAPIPRSCAMPGDVEARRAAEEQRVVGPFDVTLDPQSVQAREQSHDRGAIERFQDQVGDLLGEVTPAASSMLRVRAQL